jgi:hypothetical protein
MAYYSIDGTRLTQIADEVRRIRGLASELTPAQMVSELEQVESGFVGYGSLITMRAKEEVCQLMSYNGVELPAIPEAYENYENACICKDASDRYFLYLQVRPWYYYAGTPKLMTGIADRVPYYKLVADVPCWIMGGMGGYEIDLNYNTLIWSKQDIPAGSTSTDVYFGGTEPVPVGTEVV